MSIASWIGWKVAGGLFKSAGGWFMAQWKWLFLLACLVLLLWGAKVIYDAFAERAMLLQERKDQIATMAQDLTIAQIEAGSERAARKQAEADKARLEILYQGLVEGQEAIRQDMRDQMAVFQGHDFTKIVQAKPGLIETKANRATQERIDELAAVFND